MRWIPVLLLLIPCSPAQSVVNVGDAVPMPEAEQLWNAPFRRLDDSWGKAVLFVWFLTEEQGARFVGRLNELHDRHHEQGLVVVAVTHRPLEQVESWIKRHRPRFAVAHEPSNLSMGACGFMQWPSALLSSPRHRVLWRGGGASAPAAAIKAALKTAEEEGPDAALRIVAALPPRLGRVQSAMEQGKLGKALAALPEKGGAEQQTRRLITDLLQSKTDAAAAAEKEGRYYQAEMLLKRLVQHAPRTSWGDGAAESLRRYGRDPKIRAQVAGGKILAEAERWMAEKKYAHAERSLKKLLTRRYEGTAVRSRAKALLERLK